MSYKSFTWLCNFVAATGIGLACGSYLALTVSLLERFPLDASIPAYIQEQILPSRPDGDAWSFWYFTSEEEADEKCGGRYAVYLDEPADPSSLVYFCTIFEDPGT